MPWFAMFALHPGLLVLILLIEVIAITGYVHNNKGGQATWTVIFGLVLLHLAGVLNLGWVVEHPLSSFLWFLGYLVCGLIWCSIKWKSYLHNWAPEARKNIRQAKLRYIEDNSSRLSPEEKDVHRTSNQAVAIPPSLSEGWDKHKDSRDVKVWSTAPSPQNHVGEIVTWATYWPFSLMWTALGDWLTKLFKYLIYEVLGTFFQRMSDSTTNKLKSEI